ncbi:MAG: chromate resistance protein [Gemmatimonadetes bacterium]|nr:MAG: chromate resistance protein [Gemmatimonadota bacterium]
MLWVTRPHCHVDRTGCAWAIRRFVDPEASFGFASDLTGARALGGTPFDIRGAELGHHEGRCSFESLLVKYQLDDPSLHELAQVIHEADIDDDRFHTPEAAGLDAVIRGLGLVIEDDLQLFAITDRVYEGLYAWFGRTLT